MSRRQKDRYCPPEVCPGEIEYYPRNYQQFTLSNMLYAYLREWGVRFEHAERKDIESSWWCVGLIRIPRWLNIGTWELVKRANSKQAVYQLLTQNRNEYYADKEKTL